MNSRRVLETYKTKTRSNTADILRYCRQFSAISRNFVAEGELDLFTPFRWFLQGLPSHLQTEKFYQYELDPNNNLNMEFDNLLKKAMGLLEAKKKLATLVHVKKEDQEVGELVEKCDYKAQISSNPNRLFISLSMPTYQSPILPAVSSFQAGGAEYWPVDKEIDQLKEMMQGLALSVWILQNYIGHSAGNSRSQPLPVTFSGLSQPNISGLSFQYVWPKGVNKCSYCWASLLKAAL